VSNAAASLLADALWHIVGGDSWWIVADEGATSTDSQMETAQPLEEYTRRLEARASALSQLQRRELAISRARLLAALGGLGLWSMARALWAISAAWLLAPVVAFVALVVVHHRARRARGRTQRAVEFYEHGVARLTERWSGTGEGGERFRDESHPYAEDLDLFGRGSLFELLCTARTRAGEDTLAGWLLSPASPDEVRERQVAVAELRPKLDLREDLAAIGIDVRAGLHPEALAAWGSAPAMPRPGGLRFVAAVLVGLSLGSLLGWGMGVLGPRPAVLALSLQGVFALVLRTRVRRAIREVERPARDLALLSHLLGRLETECFEAPRLTMLRAALDTGGLSPSRQIARLGRQIDLLYARNNELFAPVSGLLLWATQCVLAIEAWRAANGAAITRWIDVVGEMEALCALAGYAYEHPEDPFPEIVQPQPWFQAEQLGHPLIPESRCVRNDVRLGGDLRLLIVSGSNMSGKSTLLRAVGTNAVLAQAGAPVRARRLRLSPLTVGASIRLHDSLQAGVSRFYAEITRLRQLVDLTQGASALLFLLDEVLHGTNSHDRRIGAEAVVRELVERRAVGLVTTHDLALAQMSDALGARAANVHFEDHLENGKMSFDYRMRPGVVTKSNALALMRAVGLEV